MERTSLNQEHKAVHREKNLGVIVIFVIVTIIFLLSLAQSNYSRELFSQKTEFRK